MTCCFGNEERTPGSVKGSAEWPATRIGIVMPGPGASFSNCRASGQSRSHLRVVFCEQQAELSVMSDVCETVNSALGI